ncbi:MAG: hypothetical protein WAO20_16640 [Acidobacteriota bacterium]
MLKQIFVLAVCGLLGGSPLVAQTSRRLDTTTFIVMGEGLAAGVYNFSLSNAGQQHSFPSLVAQQMGALFPQPVIQPPGIGNVMGFADLPVRLPAALQTTVRRPFPPYLFVFNLSIPGLTAADAVTRRPVSPLIQAGDTKQTVVNFILGFPQLILEDPVPLWTQLEYAEAMHPTFAIVELGYSEVLDAAVHGDLSRLPDPGAFRANFEQIVSGLRSTYADVLVMTVPDPIDSGYFNSPVWAAELTRVPTYVVLGLYGLSVEDWITVPGLVEIGNQFLERRSAPLPSGSYIDAATADEISAYVDSMNQDIRSIASSHGAVVFDLHGLIRDFKDNGAVVSGHQLRADFLRGLYSLDGYYPGATGQALIANAVLQTLNTNYGTNFSPVSLDPVLAADSVVDYKVSTGDRISLESLSEFIPAEKMRYILRVKSQLEASSRSQSTPRPRSRGNVSSRERRQP